MMTLITDPMDAPSVTAARRIGRDRGVGPSLLEANASISQILPPDTNKDVIIHFISSHSLRQFVAKRESTLPASSGSARLSFRIPCA